MATTDRSKVRVVQQRMQMNLVELRNSTKNSICVTLSVRAMIIDLANKRMQKEKNDDPSITIPQNFEKFTHE